MEDTLRPHICGTHVKDIITNVKTGEVNVIERDDNLVVMNILPLITALLSNDPTIQGIQYWAVGSGVNSWDTAPVDPIITETSLTREIGRIPIDTYDIIYIDPDTLKESEIPTNKIQVTALFDIDDCNGVWREFGLFGGNASEAKDSGFMVDKKHHSILIKDEEMMVERRIILTISL